MIHARLFILLLAVTKQLTLFKSTPSTSCMYVGISVMRVKKPQFCPQWATITAQNGSDVIILHHGAGYLCKKESVLRKQIQSIVSVSRRKNTLG